MNDIPVVASNLPGVRVPISMTGMGEVIPIGDSAALAEAVRRIFSSPDDFHGRGADLRRTFSPDEAAQKYERLFEAIQSEIL